MIWLIALVIGTATVLGVLTGRWLRRLWKRSDPMSAENRERWR